MDKIILFIALSVPVIYVSKQSLLDSRSHGFTRFFSWECIIALFVINYEQWFREPLSYRQIASWILLFVSIWFVFEGALRLRKARKSGVVRVDDKLFRFEKTTELVTTGIFRYIRHPMYSSLLLLAWGIWLKQPMLASLPVVLLSSWLLWVTARRDEALCISHFGNSYREYMGKTKRLIPFIL